MTVIYKICTECNVEKQLTEYNNQKLGKYGKRATCRECQNAKNRAYKKTERGIELRKKWKRSEVGKENNKRYRERNHEKIKEYWRTEAYKTSRNKSIDKQRFGGNRIKALERDNYKCVECGTHELLQVHHKDEMGRNKPKQLQNNNLNNLITLCATCHINKHNPVLKRWGKV